MSGQPKPLAPETIAKICALYATEEYTQRELARRFGVSASVICRATQQKQPGRTL